MNEKDERSMKNSVLIRRLLPYYRKYVGILVLDLFCASLTSACDLVLPVIVREITNTAVNDIASLTVTFVLRLGLLYIGLRVMDVAAQYFMSYTGHMMGAAIERDMRSDLFSHLQQLSFSYFDNTKIGQIMGRVTNDLFEITEFSHHCPEEYLIATLKMVIAFVVLSRYDFLLTLVIFLLIPVMIVCTILFRKRMRKASKKRRVLVGEMNARLEDSLLGTRVVKSFANEEIEEEKFEQSNEAFFNIKNEWYRVFAGFHTTTRFFDGMMYITVVVVGALFIIKGRITAPDLIAFLLYVSMLLASVRQIVNFFEQFQNGMTGLERFCEIMDTPSEITDAPDATELPPVKGDIRFENVSFHYTDHDKQVLSHLDIEIPAGENVALVGPSGGGKTTLCNLIPRFYEVTDGRILVDGTDIRTVTMKSLRNQIGMVQQDVYLFSGTVRDNIEYGKPGAGFDEIVEAARKAGADEFIRELPDGYDTYVGERGVKLSGGQKQRISIARVFLKNPPILILDEATSALDNEGELLVQKSLEKLAVGRTTLTIAHRLTTIRNAKKILVLTKDGIAEAGTHDELMAKDGLYAKMYRMYQL